MDLNTVEEQGLQASYITHSQVFHTPHWMYQVFIEKLPENARHEKSFKLC